MLIDMIRIFEDANSNFIRYDKDLFEMEVSERTLCGGLKSYLEDEIKSSIYNKYFVDVEYNRNQGGKLKTIKKTIKGPDMKIITINCDLIIHSRGHNLEQDNLIAIEMKKSNISNDEKNNDRDRLIALTKDSYDDIWSYDGKALPEHVCRYLLGVYYEVNFNTKKIILEYYSKGALYTKKIIIYE